MVVDAPILARVSSAFCVHSDLNSADVGCWILVIFLKEVVFLFVHLVLFIVEEVGQRVWIVVIVWLHYVAQVWWPKSDLVMSFSNQVVPDVAASVLVVDYLISFQFAFDFQA